MGWDILRQRPKIKAFFIDEAGLIIDKKFKYTNNTFSTKAFGEPQAYIVDHNFIVYDKKTKIPVSLYYVNNPSPIRIQHERNKELDGIGFKKILDSKTISELFSEENKNVMLILIILIGLNMLLTAVVLLVQFKVIKVGGG